MTKKKREKPVHIEKRECWCEPVWVAGRYVPGVLLHRQNKDEPATIRLEAANGRAS